MQGPAGAQTASYLIGVDTGGTYTDAAVIEARGHRILATAKAITTKGDLAVGVAEAITRALAKLPHEVPPQSIGMVSVSTTLATNAVVEGHGSATGVVLIGFDATMVERTGIGRGFLSSEVDRYTSDPGQALAYMIGALKIAELRDRAKAALGDRFELRRFHNAVIDNGALPLSTLEHLIDEWIASQRGKP